MDVCASDYGFVFFVFLFFVEELTRCWIAIFNSCNDVFLRVSLSGGRVADTQWTSVIKFVFADV